MIHALHNLAIFTQSEQAKLVNVIWALLQVHTGEQFRVWTQTELQSIFPHGALICGVGYINRPAVHMIGYLNVNFPAAYMEEIRQPDGGVLSPIMDRWLKENKPQLFDPGQSGEVPHQEWMEIFNRHDLRNIAAHGMYCSNKPVSSYFNFSRIPEPLGPRHAFLLELLVPQMHSVLTRVLLQKDFERQILISSLPVKLTQREQEILQRMSEGKTNVEIAEVLFLSNETVKSHVRKIFFKLDAKTRTEAVNRAREMGFFASVTRRIYSRHDD